MGLWMRYANFELEQKEFARARSIFERALDVDSREIPLWVKYIDSEIKTKNVNHARNLLDRAVTLLPRVDKLWYKYVYMEEALGNISGVRAIFERWMAWEPEEGAWGSYINFEKRYKEFGRARSVFERLTFIHPEGRNWLKWTKFEEEYGSPDQVRQVFNMAIDNLQGEYMDEKIIIAFARYESRSKEIERARAIFKYALDNMPRSKSAALFQAYTTFEKQYGEKDGIQDVVSNKRRLHYEELVSSNSKNYDAWFDYARLEESTGDVDRTREVYERAIAEFPPTEEKRHWRRYIYLWLFYALFEELQTKDYERARKIYRMALDLVPHKKFTFAKLWLLAAQFELRIDNISGARKLLGRAIGTCPKDKLFKGYIDMEMMLREYDRCRKIYEKFLEHSPSNVYAWIKFAELEIALEEEDRWRAIFEMALEQDLDMPELVWKSYIFAESESEQQGAEERVQNLFKRVSNINQGWADAIKVAQEED